MLEIALKILDRLESNGYSAYIVGGFVRDILLNRESTDVDITTSATPKNIKEIFKDSCISNEEYGSVTVVIKNIRFEITTYRREYSYLNNRKPIEFEYINSLSEDLSRRDFLMNTLCMDKNKNIIDLFDAKNDISEKIIHTVGNSYDKFSEDVLRILRAVRFATVLDFKLSDEVKNAILLNRYLLKNLSGTRKREELDKIFTSCNAKKGVKLLLELELDEYLGIKNLKNVTKFNDLLGVWAILDVDDYPFTKNEKEIMEHIRTCLKLSNTSRKVLYKYGLYVNIVAGDIKGLDKQKITETYNNLEIKQRSDIVINGKDIIDILNIKPSLMIKDILSDIEDKILDGKLKNNREILEKYIVETYK